MKKVTSAIESAANDNRRKLSMAKTNNGEMKWRNQLSEMVSAAYQYEAKAVGEEIMAKMKAIRRKAYQKVAYEIFSWRSSKA